MFQKLLSSFVATLLLVACSYNQKDGTGAAADAAVITVPTPMVTDTITNIMTVSETEMKDDSVFTDGSIPTSWTNAGISDVRGLKFFLKQAQQWVMNNDKSKLAAAVRYPLNGVNSEQQLIEKYDQLFTKDVKLAFAKINFNQIFRNQNGVMIDGGKVWITQEGKDFKIFAINN